MAKRLNNKEQNPLLKQDYAFNLCYIKAFAKPESRSCLISLCGLAR